MQLFIMRHGEATSDNEDDTRRQLTDQGRADVTAIATQHLQDLAAVEAIWASPYIRAQQTAALVAAQLDKPVITQPWLVPTENTDHLVNALQSAQKSVLVVSHQPLVGTLLDRLADLETGRYRMGTGSLACIDLPLVGYRCGQLEWLHHPSVAS